MSFKFFCLYCGQHLECDDELENTVINCPKCDKK